MYFSVDIRYTDQSSNSAGMLWSSSVSPIEEIDAGMMPPPSILPPNVRHSSLSGTMIDMQSQISPPVLKSELLDETSQGSQPDLMINQNSMDGIPSNDNSLDGSKDNIQYMSPQHQRAMMVCGGNISPSDLCIQDSNSMNAFDQRMRIMQMGQASPEVIDLRIKQEQQHIAAQIQQYSNDAQLLQVVQSNLGAAAADVQHQQQHMFSQSSGVGQAHPHRDVIFSQEINELNNQITVTVSNNPTFAMMTDNVTGGGSTSATISQLMGYNNSPTMGGNSAATLSQDNILSAQPSNVSLSSPLSIITGAQSANVSSDIILNPTVSPSMMCQSTSDNSNNIMTPQVTSVLACMSSQSSQDSLMNTLIPTDAMQHLPRSPVAVKNMILNAAADILSSQPSTISPETTISALISLNSSPLINTNQTGGSQMLITQAPTTSNTLLIQQQNDHAAGQQHSIYSDSGAGMSTATQQIMAEQGSVQQQQQAIMMAMGTMGVQTTQQMDIVSGAAGGTLTRAEQDFLNDFQKMQ